MRGRHRRFKLFKVTPVLIATCALLGTSYAYWGQITVVDTTIQSGQINATATLPATLTSQSNESYIMCSNIRCNSGENHHKNSKVSVKLAQDSIPISIRSVEVIGFSYWSEMYQIKDEEVCVGTEWKKFGWRWKEVPVYEDRPVLSKANPFTKKVEFNQDQLKSLTLSATMQGNTMNIDLDDQKIKDAMRCQWQSKGNQFEIWNFRWRRLQNVTRPAHADIDTSKTGSIDLKIVYTQFNTKYVGGWEKEIILEDIPVYWYRLDPNSHKNNIYPITSNGVNYGMTITPGDESTFDY